MFGVDTEIRTRHLRNEHSAEALHRHLVVQSVSEIVDSHFCTWGLHGPFDWAVLDTAECTSAQIGPRHDHLDACQVKQRLVLRGWPWSAGVFSSGSKLGQGGPGSVSWPVWVTGRRNVSSYRFSQKHHKQSQVFFRSVAPRRSEGCRTGLLFCAFTAWVVTRTPGVMKRRDTSHTSPCRTSLDAARNIRSGFKPQMFILLEFFPRNGHSGICNRHFYEREDNIKMDLR